MTAGWAALNTLREGRDWIADDDPGEADTGGFHSSMVTNLDAALALVQTALEAAEFALHSVDPNSTLAYNNLAAALRAVREGQ